MALMLFIVFLQLTICLLEVARYSRYGEQVHKLADSMALICRWLVNLKMKRNLNSGFPLRNPGTEIATEFHKTPSLRVSPYIRAQLERSGVAFGC